MIPRQSEIQAAGAAQAGAGAGAGMVRSTKYLVECFDKDGKLKWSDEFHNLVTTEGLNDSLSKHFKASAYTAAWYVGLTSGTPTFAAANTLASHAGWTEVTSYTEGARQALTLGTPSAGSVDNAAAKATFSINANGTVIGGAFIANAASGTSGVLYGGGAFSAGNKTLDNGDTLSVTVTLTAASA